MFIIKEPSAEEIAAKEAFENTPIAQLTVKQFRNLMDEIDANIKGKEEKRRIDERIIEGMQRMGQYDYRQSPEKNLEENQRRMQHMANMQNTVRGFGG